MRAVVFAYQEIGFVCLEALLEAGVEVACLFTHDDDPDEEIWFRTPAAAARRQGIPVYTPENIREEKWVTIVRNFQPDVIFSFYYRKMIPTSILDIPHIGAFNLHGSLLPQYRGRCPVNWVIIAGEDRTGVTLHYMVEKPDAGDIVAQKEVAIDFDDDVLSVYRKLVRAADELMRDILPKIKNGTFTRTAQTGPSSYFGGRKPEDGLIDWNQDAIAIYNLTRAVTHPYPGAFTYLNGKKLFIWKAHPVSGPSVEAPAGSIISEDPFIVKTASGALQLISVQIEGESEINAGRLASSHILKNIILGGHP
ncbi:MAG: formyltransferase [Syntrophorhabdaceae bacterium]|nr:formyltransferase [Syntrophorhabdaceae bacterium]MDD4195929.1 formyltransferase [Syntrophorhabdaceae bacterium]HOC46263.1 formyltransferase [Syntrophorhabdaceae bacterium]